MKLVFVSLVIAVYLANVVQGVTISDVLSRIPREEQFYETQKSTTKTTMQSNIASKRSILNSKAEALKTDIRGGSSSCQVWLSHVEGLQSSMINFMYQFRPCETDSKLGNIKIALFDMKRSADRVAALCRIQSPSVCQSQINSLNTGLDRIHSSIEDDTAMRLRTSNDCIEKRGADIDRLLNSSRESWMKCV